MRLTLHVLRLAVSALPLLFLAACQPRSSSSWQGYIEAEYVYVGSSLAGTLQSRPIVRGQGVTNGELLFVLEQDSEKAALQEAERRLQQARARLENLTKGRRPTEIASLEARLSEAKAGLKLAELEADRQSKLLQTKVSSAQEWDQARTRHESAKANVAALEAELETARLGARVDEVKAAEADVEAQQAVLAKARWAVEQKTRRAPAAGVLHDVLYRQGEWVGAGNPVAVLLPPDNIKVRFFVPETSLALMKPGLPIRVRVDGLTNAFAATVSYISTQAEFTPPVIFSRETRAKLVFMVEAVFAPGDAARLRPGQPAEVEPASGSGPGPSPSDTP